MITADYKQLLWILYFIFGSWTKYTCTQDGATYRQYSSIAVLNLPGLSRIVYNKIK